MFTPATITVRSPGRTSCTRPRLPRSFPVITTTSSPWAAEGQQASKHLRRERNDLHEVALTELARDRPEDARPARLSLRIQEHGRVVVEADERAVVAPVLLGLAHHDRAHDLALFHARVRDRVLHRGDEDVADLGRRTGRRMEHADHRELPRSRVVRAAHTGVWPDHFSSGSSGAWGAAPPNGSSRSRTRS